MLATSSPPRTTRPQPPSNDLTTTAHLTLGLLAEPDAIAAGAIRARGVTLDAVRNAVVATLPPPSDAVPDLIPYDGARRSALELTYREALRLGHNYIGTEHILLAILEREDGDGPLAALGLDKASVESTILAALAAIVAANTETPSTGPTTGTPG